MRAKRMFMVVPGALLLGAAFAGCAPLTNRMLLFPSKDGRAVGAAERVMIASAGGAIETIRAKSPSATTTPARAIVLRFYGNADRADEWPAREAAAFGDSPVEVWGVNYPGFGKSEGNASLDGVARAADVAFAEADKRGLPIYAMGTSMGTTAALHLGKSGKLRGIFLQNPPPLRQLIRGRYGWWNLWLVAVPVAWNVPPSLDSIENARRTTVPTLVVSAQDDEVVPFDYQTAVFEACAGAKERIVIAGAHHNDPVSDAIWVDIRAAMHRLGWP